MRTRIALLAAAGLSLGACAANGVYAGGDAGLAYNDGLYDPAACWNTGFLNYGFSSPYCGWYDGYFYPGSGNYVYDRYRNRHAWTGPQQQHWTTQARGPNGRTVGLGSSGGVVPPRAARQPMTPNTGAGAGPRGFGPGPARLTGAGRARFGGGRPGAGVRAPTPRVGGGSGRSR
jgi:hypothetical protein